MESIDAEQMWKAMTVIEAQKCLVAIDIASFPHKTQEARDKAHRNYYEQAFPEVFSEPKIITGEDLARLING